MAGIPSKCPQCGSSEQWKERINPVTSGVPIGKHVRFRLLVVRGLLAYPFKKALGCYTVQYRCSKCGFRKEYPTEDS